MVIASYPITSNISTQERGFWGRKIPIHHLVDLQYRFVRFVQWRG
jgi:hypothetical protein